MEEEGIEKAVFNLQYDHQSDTVDEEGVACYFQFAGRGRSGMLFSIYDMIFRVIKHQKECRELFYGCLLA